MIQRVIVSAVVFLLVFVGIAGCAPKAVTLQPLQPLQFSLVSVSTTVIPDKQIDVVSTLEVFNPNDFGVKLVGIMHKVQPNPPGWSFWAPVYDLCDLTVPAKERLRVTGTTSIPKEGPGAANWNAITSPSTFWVVTGQAFFARDADQVAFTGITMPNK